MNFCSFAGNSNRIFIRVRIIHISQNIYRGSRDLLREVRRPPCLISYGGGLGMSPCIMGLTTQDPYIQKEHTELYKILKFRVNWANIEQDTAIQKLQNLQRNVWISGQVSGNPYIC